MDCVSCFQRDCRARLADRGLGAGLRSVVLPDWALEERRCSYWNRRARWSGVYADLALLPLDYYILAGCGGRHRDSRHRCANRYTVLLALAGVLRVWNPFPLFTFTHSPLPTHICLDTYPRRFILPFD